jgi:regulator of cell morphogenesis and NO signaling
MTISPDSIVGEVVKYNYKTAPLFQANNIDYCCNGDIDIATACMKVGIDATKLIRQIEKLVLQNDPDTDHINNIGLGELCSYIIKKHHAYVNSSIPILLKNLEKICQVHGEHHPELYDIKELFISCAGNLTKHMQKEEIMLFPFIERLESLKKQKAPSPKSPFGSVSNPIRMMVADHQNEGERFNKIAKLTNNYQPPDDACSTYEVTFKQLRDFEDDLHRHIHLENNILFPKAIDLEYK